MQITPPKDSIIVKIDRSMEDEIKLAGGIKLFLSTRLNLQEHVTIKGICVGVPPFLKREDLQVIEPIVEIGDEVYFSYQTIFDQFLTEDVQYYMNEIKIDGESYWIVDYICVFFVKRGEKIEMVGSHVLVEPIEENLKVPDFLVLPKSMTDVQRKDKGIVKAIGCKNIGAQDIEVKNGDMVLFDEKYIERYNIWDKPYYIIKQDRILSKCNSTSSTTG